MIDLGLIIARLLHYAAVTSLAGVWFFPLYAYTATGCRCAVQWPALVSLLGRKHERLLGRRRRS